MTKVDFGIIGALDEELTLFLEAMEIESEKEIASMKYYKGKLITNSVVVVKSGIGKVLSSVTATNLINEYDPDKIIFVGVAGSLNPEYKIGDVVISTDLIQHDFDVSAMGIKRGQIPRTNHYNLIADEELTNIAIMTKIKNNKIHLGRILSGDQFVTKEFIENNPYLLKEMNGDAIEMEGASVALVCKLYQKPFVIIRTLSDNADGTATHDYKKFLPRAADTNFEIVKKILQN